MESLSVSTYPSQTADSGPVVSERERERLAAVQRYAILDTPPDGAFDRVTRLAAHLFDVPIAIVSIVDHDRIWLKSSYGIEGLAEIPREPGLCSSAIEGDEPYIVERADIDPRCRANSLVAGPFGLRFYVGVPLATGDGYNLGTLCVLDNAPREAEPAKVEMLESLAKIVVDELELRLAARRLAEESERRLEAESKGVSAERFALTDELTGFGNRRALEREFDALAAADATQGSVVIIDVDGLKRINDRRGHDVGDRFLREFAAALGWSFANRPIFRYGGDEFVIVAGAEKLAKPDVAEALRATLRRLFEDGFPEASASFGLAAFDEIDGSARAALRLADSRLYSAKVARR